MCPHVLLSCDISTSSLGEISCEGSKMVNSTESVFCALEKLDDMTINQFSQLTVYLLYPVVLKMP